MPDLTRGPDGVPMLGVPKPTHGGAAINAIVRKLDENGLFPVIDGRVERGAYLDASELVAWIVEETRAALRDDLVTMMRRIVREELAVKTVLDTPSRADSRAAGGTA